MTVPLPTARMPRIAGSIRIGSVTDSLSRIVRSQSGEALPVALVANTKASSVPVVAKSNEAASVGLTQQDRRVRAKRP